MSPGASIRPGAPPSAAVVLVLAAIVAALCAPSAPATSSNVTVTMNLASTTSLDASGCAGGSAGRTDFGSVLPGSTMVTTSDCSIVFGSSNDTAALRVFQRDGRGTAMHRPATGVLDTTFDGDGRALARISANYDEAYDAAEQPDGSIVVVGEAWNGTNEDIALVKFTPSGALDTSFGGGDGIVTTAVLAGDDVGREVAVQGDGKIVVGGNAHNGVNTDYAVLRYGSDGTLDPTFGGGDGITTFDVATWSDYVDGLELMDDGRIVIVGESWITGTQDAFSAARLNADGSLDTTFSGDGKLTQPMQVHDWGNGMVLQPDGRLLVVGASRDAGGAFDVGVARFTVAGALDTSFSGDGILIQSLGPENDYGTAIAIQPDGKLLVGAESYAGGNAVFGVLRLHPNGTLDTNADADPSVHFGSDGIVQHPIGAGSAYLWSVGLQEDGNVVAAGNAWMGGSDYDFAVMRMSPDGALDVTLDGDGSVVTAVAGAANDMGRGALIGDDGRILAFGDALSGGDDDFAVVRYDTTRIADFGAGSDWSTGANSFGACLHTVAGGAVGSWPVAGAGNCTTALAANWRAVPAASSAPSAKVAAAPVATPSAVANLRFGMRAAGDQARGRYAAALTIEVVAPSG